MIRSLAVISGIYICAKAIAGLTTIAMAFMLPTDEYAKFAIYYSIITGFAAVAQSGFYESSASQNDNQRNTAIKARQASVVKLFSISAFCLLAFSFITERYPAIPSFITAVLYAGCIGLSVAAGNVYSNVSRLVQENKIGMSILIACTGLTSIGYTIGGYTYHSAAAALQYSAMLGALVLMVVLLITKKTKLEKKTDTIRKRKDNRIFADYWIIALLGWASGYGMNIVLYKITSPDYISNFFLVFNITSIIITIAAAINTAWGPNFITKSIQDYELARLKNLQISRLLIITVSIASALIIFFSNDVVGILHEVKSTAVPKNMNYLALALASTVMSVPWWEVQNYYTRDGESRLYSTNVIITSLTGLAVWIAAAYCFGEVGIYIGFFLNAFIRTCFFLWLSKKKYRTKSTLKESVLASVVIIMLGYLYV